MALVMMWRPLVALARAKPLRAQLSDSVPPLEKKISRGVAPMRLAKLSRAAATASEASWPKG